MPQFGVRFTTSDAYLEVEAEDSDDAMQKAYEELTCRSMTSFTWDCNECVDITEWKEG